MQQNHWPLNQTQLARVLHSMICGHLGDLIDFSTFTDAEGLPLRETPLGGSGYPLDSISLIALAGQVSRMFHLAEVGNEEFLLRRRNLGAWCDLILESWAPQLRQISFSSSGSTGIANPATHQQDLLLQETDFLAGLFKDRSRIIALVPAHHIYGFLFTVLLPARMQVPLVEARHLGCSGLARELQDQDLVISHPFHWQYLCQLLPDVSAGVQGVSSTAPCPAEVFHHLRTKGFSRLVEVYGASETGGLGWRDEPEAPFQLFDYWSPLEQTKGEPLLERTLPGGEKLEITPPDRLEWLDLKQFRVTGRRDGVVQVAGHNVSPQAVARILTEHPEVQSCSVRLMSPEEGQRLKAFVVPAPGVEIEGLAARLHQWSTRELRPPQRPGHYRFGLSLPANQMGKAADWKIL